MSLTAALRDLNKLNTFVRVAERRSFTKAAADLSTTPSVISKRMKELEDSLGFSLLNRSTHGIVLTDAGEGLYQNFMQMLASLDDYVVEARNLQAGPVGTLRVQTTNDYARCVLTPLIVEFSRRHPGLRVHLAAMSDYGAASEDGFDVIVSGKKPALPGLVDLDLGPLKFVICASPEYFRRFGTPREPQSLREHNCLENQYSGVKDWPFHSVSRPLHVEVKGSLSSDTYAVLIQMALCGVGIVRVPAHAVRAELKSESLVAIFEHSALSPERVCAHFSKSKHLPAKTADFVEFLRVSLTASL